MSEQQFYDELMARKQAGEVLNFAKLDEPTLRRLWQEVPDALIGDLYDVDKSDVTKLRRKLNINKYNTWYPQMINQAFAQAPGATTPQHLPEVAAQRVALSSLVNKSETHLPAEEENQSSTWSYTELTQFLRLRREAAISLADWASEVESFAGAFLEPALVIDGDVYEEDVAERFGWELEPCEAFHTYVLEVETPDGRFKLAVGEYKEGDAIEWSPVFVNGDWRFMEEGEDEEPDWSVIQLFWSEPNPTVFYNAAPIDSSTVFEDLSQREMDALRCLVMSCASEFARVDPKMRAEILP